MFWKRKEGQEVDPAPKKLPGIVSRYLIDQQKKKADWVANLNAVMRPTGEGAIDIRIFDTTEAMIKEIKVENWATLDAHPELIIYEGRFDEKSKKVELQ